MWKHFWELVFTAEIFTKFSRGPCCFLLVHWLNSCFPVGPFFSRLFSQKAASAVVNYSRIYIFKKVIVLQYYLPVHGNLLECKWKHHSRLSEMPWAFLKQTWRAMYVDMTELSNNYYFSNIFPPRNRPEYVHDNNLPEKHLQIKTSKTWNYSFLSKFLILSRRLTQFI
jgi:hypothetical protein